MNSRRAWGPVFLAGLTCLGTAGVTYAVDPNPLENAYWRFEEGTAGSFTAQGPNSVLDSINENHMRWFDPDAGSALNATVSGNTLTDPSKNWIINQWLGHLCAIQGTHYAITANTAQTLTLMDTPPEGPQDYAIFTFAPAPVYTTDVPVAIIPQTGQANTLALQFTPNDDVYSDGQNINNPLADAMTIEVAFKPGTVTTFQGIVGKDGKPSAESPLQTWVLKIRADNSHLQVEFFDRGGAVRSIESIAPLVAGQWYYAAVVTDQTTCSLYLDRNEGAGYQLEGTTDVTEGPIWQGADRGAEDGFNTNWTIGRGMYNGGVTDWYTGIIDEVRITNRALAVEEFLFSSGFAPGDLDRDRDVDFDDEVLLISCGTGPEVPYDPENPPPGCTLEADLSGRLAADLDEDGDIDSTDFGMIQALLGS